MARKSLIIKCRRNNEKVQDAHKKGKKIPKLKVRSYNRCRLCGRPRGYMRDFDMCRICFREHASHGEISGIKKSSW